MSRWGSALMFCVLALSSASVRAQPSLEQAPLDEAERLIVEEAGFEAALDQLAVVAREGELDREGAVRLLALRAVVELALERGDAAGRSLRQLHQLDPAHAFPRWVPPRVRDAFAAVAEAPPPPLGVSAVAGHEGEVVQVVVAVEGDAHGLVERVRIHARPPEGEWVTHLGHTLEVRAEALSYYVEVLGPGGAVLVADGSREAPRRVLPPAVPAPEVLEITSAPPPQEGSDDALVWGLVGGGVLVLAAVVTVIVVLATTPPPQTDFGALDPGWP